MLIKEWNAVSLKAWLGTAQCIEVVFYFLVFQFFTNQFEFLTQHSFASRGADAIWTHSWWPSGWDLRPWAVAVAYLQLLLFPLLFFGLRQLWVRALIFALVFFNVAMRFNYLDAHNHHLYLYVSFVFLFSFSQATASSQRVRFVQAQILLVYFISGVWKFWASFESLLGSAKAPPLEFLRYSIAEEYLNSNTFTALGQWIVNQGSLSAGVQFLTVVMEVGALGVIFVPRLYPFWGLLLVTFHSFTRLTMGLYFRDTQMIVMCFLVLPTAIDLLRRSRPDLSWQPEKASIS